MCALLKTTKFHKKQCIKELFSFNSSKNRSTTRDARGYENPFGSSAPRGMRGQACVKYTKKTPRRPVSGALLCRGTWSYYFRSSPGTTPSLSRHYPKGRLGLPLPVRAIIICRGLNAILPFATCLPSYHWPQQLICRQRSPHFGTLELFLQLVSRSTSSAFGIGPFPIPLKFSF